MRRMMLVTATLLAATLNMTAAKAGDWGDPVILNPSDPLVNLPTHGSWNETWWFNADEGEKGPVPPAHKLAGAMVERYFGCSTNLEEGVVRCPGPLRKGVEHVAQPYVEGMSVDFSMSFWRVDGKTAPLKVLFGQRSFVQCGRMVKAFEPSTKWTDDQNYPALRLDRLCTVNGVAFRMEFRLVYTGGGQIT